MTASVSAFKPLSPPSVCWYLDFSLLWNLSLPAIYMLITLRFFPWRWHMLEWRGLWLQLLSDACFVPFFPVSLFVVVIGLILCILLLFFQWSTLASTAVVLSLVAFLIILSPLHLNVMSACALSKAFLFSCLLRFLVWFPIHITCGTTD